MILTCDMCRDMVGLYKDKVASEDTVRAVNLHLKNCPSCREYYQSYDSMKQMDAENYSVPINEEYHIKHYNDISKRLRKRYHINTSIVSALTLASAAFIVINIVKFINNRNTEYDS